MGKIRQLREDQIIKGGSQEHIYPITHSKAVYTEDKEQLQEALNKVKSGDYLFDSVIKTRHIADKNVTTEKINNEAVTTEKIKDSSVTTNKILNNAVTASKIADGNVTNEKLIEDAVDNRVLAADAVQTENVVDQNITTPKIKDYNITEEKMALNSVSNRTIQERNVTEDKMATDSISTRTIIAENVTESKMARNSVSTRTIRDENVTENKLANSAVTTVKIMDSAIVTDKIADKNITNEKIADNTLTLDKFDADLRNSLEAATGLPSDILERFQNMSEDIAELQDSTYPIVLSMGISFVNPTHTVSFNVKNKGKDFVGDILSLTKTLGNGIVKTLSNIPAASGIAQSPIEYNKETFKLEVGAKGHTTKSTSITRYICYAGSNASDTITEEVIGTFNVYSSPNVAFNPTVNTQDNQYIWLVVPSYLTISRVTSSGFNVTLAAVQTITTSLGEFKAYRTANVLTTQKWNLVIS